MNFRFVNCKVIAVAVALVTAINCVSIVPTEYTGVRTTFGQIASETMPNGLNLNNEPPHSCDFSRESGGSEI